MVPWLKDNILNKFTHHWAITEDKDNYSPFWLPVYSARESMIKHSGSWVNNLLQPDAEYSLSWSMWRSMDEWERAEYEEILRESILPTKPNKVGPDRKWAFDHVYSSQVMIGMENERLPSFV